MHATSDKSTQRGNAVDHYQMRPAALTGKAIEESSSPGLDNLGAFNYETCKTEYAFNYLQNYMKRTVYQQSGTLTETQNTNCSKCSTNRS